MKQTFISKKNTIILSASGLAVLILFTVSFVLFNVNNTKKRFVYIFPSADKSVYVLESRYLSKPQERLSRQKQSEYYLRKFVDDLLLGATTERTKLLFCYGTQVQSCFIRDNTVYLDLSKDLLRPQSDCADIKEGAALLIMNIKRNFKDIKKVELFVDKVLAYDGADLKITQFYE